LNEVKNSFEKSPGYFESRYPCKKKKMSKQIEALVKDKVKKFESEFVLKFR
jgi:hypothetical protein